MATVSVKPIAPYIGGKSKLAPTIIPIIESIPHKSYAEPFVGMGGIFLRRTKRRSCEFINDYNSEVANLFRIIQRHENAFIKALYYMIASRQHFNMAWQIPPHTLTDIDRAVRFFYIQRLGFGGQPQSKCFGVAKNRPGRLNPQKIQYDIKALARRLSGVVIENLDFGEFLHRYDYKDMLFYLDPPYYECESDYGKDLFKRTDFERLNDCLTDIKGAFILSLNDRPEVRDIFHQFNIISVKTTYKIARNNQKQVAEVLISNRDISI